MVDYRLITGIYGCLIFVVSISAVWGMPCTGVKNISPQTLQACTTIHTLQLATSDIHIDSKSAEQLFRETANAVNFSKWCWPM